MIGNSVGTISGWEQGRHDIPVWAARLIERLVADHEANSQERRAA